MDAVTPPHATAKRSFADNAQMHAGTGLMRYHSAPSCVLASLIHNEDFFCESIPHMETFELGRSVSPVDGLGTLILQPNASDLHANASVLHANLMPGKSFEADEHCAGDILSSTKIPSAAEPDVSNAFRLSSMAMHQPAARCGVISNTTTRHLAAISEEIRDTPCMEVRISASPTMHVDMENCRKPQFSLPKLPMPVSASSFQHSLLATRKRDLIRHSSFPSNFVSGYAMEECNEGPTIMQTMVESKPPDSARRTFMVSGMPQDNIRGTCMQPSMPQDNIRGIHMQTMAKSMLQSNDDARGAHFPLPTTARRSESNQPLSDNGSNFDPFKVEDETKVVESWCTKPSISSSVLRQNSSPAGFSSQSSMDGVVLEYEKGLSSPFSGSSSEDNRRVKELHYLSRVSAFWDEAKLGMAASRQRKRERETEATIANGSCSLDSIQECCTEEESLQWSFGHMDASSGSLLSMDESVLWRARAKRGCATHPRSIAERVRRSKISEGMRKLQELVPNMEKQTNIATMLDEAVEYVKLLQQQVQKLSENQAKCNGMCHSKGNT